LAADLEIRAETLLAALPENVDGPLAERMNDLRPRVELLLEETRVLHRSSPEDPGKAESNLRTFQAISRQLRLIEQHDAPFVIRFSDADRALTSFCWTFLANIGWPYPRPLVASFSHEYYWVLPRQALIGVPVNEDQRLLGLVDLCHELGHIAFLADGAAFHGDILSEVKKWAISHRRSRDPTSTFDDAFLGDVVTSWRLWLQEFVCDAVATYLVGPAYGWQHLRLTCVEGDHAMMHQLPLDGEEHPADEARMRVILATLELLDDAAEADAIRSHWLGLAAFADPPESGYDVAYPDVLLSAVAATVIKACEKKGLRRYGLASDSCDLAVVANDAWNRLRVDPSTYKDWERATIRQCLVAPAVPATP
jgi:hypothetical protein